MHMNRSFFSTFNFIEKETPPSILSVSFAIFLGRPLLWKTSCELNLKGECEKWRINILNIHYEGKCIFENHLKKVDTELNSNFQLHHRYFFSKVFNKNILYLLLFSG